MDQGREKSVEMYDQKRKGGEKERVRKHSLLYKSKSIKIDDDDDGGTMPLSQAQAEVCRHNHKV